MQTESTLADNRAVYQKIRILPRLMRDVSDIDMTCRLLGTLKPAAFSHCLDSHGTERGRWRVAG